MDNSPPTGPAPPLPTSTTTTTTTSSSSPSPQDDSDSSSQPSSSDLSFMFDASLIPSSVSSTLPASYTIRPLHQTDYHRGFLTVLATLTSTPPMPYSDWEAQMSAMRACRDTYYILVICDRDGWVVGTGSLIVERKFIHGLGKVGHVEDISVRRDQQGKKLGLKLIQALVGVGKGVGCYKCILDCSEANEGFYVKCGFKRAGLEMAHYYEPTMMAGIKQEESQVQAPQQQQQKNSTKVDGEAN